MSHDSEQQQSSAAPTIQHGSADPASKWRQLIAGDSNPLITELWDQYTSDCRDRHAQPMPYLEFIPAAKALTHPELPGYWPIYLADCEANERYPEPYLTVMQRTQQALGEPSKGYSGSSRRGDFGPS